MWIFSGWRNDTFPKLAPHSEPWAPKPCSLLFRISPGGFWKGCQQFLAVGITVNQIHGGINIRTSSSSSSSLPKTNTFPQLLTGVFVSSIDNCLQSYPKAVLAASITSPFGKYVLVRRIVVGWTVVPQKICLCFMLQKLWMWPYLDKESVKALCW